MDGDENGVSTTLAIVIVNYNSGDYLLAALERLRGDPPGVEHVVVVVDNGSADGSVEAVESRFPEVVVLRNARNVGFGAANNLAFERVDARYYLLLNSDAEAGGAAVDLMVDTLEKHPDVGIVGARLVYPDGREQMTARMFPRPMNAVFGRKSWLNRLWPNNRFARRYMPPVRSEHAPYRVDWVSGACMMLRRRTVRDVGGFDDGYFMYWEDADLCYRALQKGWKTLHVPGARVVHHEGGSSGRTESRLIWEFHRSALRFFARSILGRDRGLVYGLAKVSLYARAAAMVAGNRIPGIRPSRPTVHNQTPDQNGSGPTR